MELTKELIKEKYNEYNATYFNGELRMCKISLYSTSTELGRYTRGHIWLAKRPKNVERLEWNEQLFKETLVHEMVHHYVCTVKGKKSFLCPHGIRFRRKCREIRRKHGLQAFDSIYIKRYAVLDRKAALSFGNGLELLYLKPLNYLLTWIF